MVFTKRLREGVKQGTITCSIRIWKSARVQAGRRYSMEEGEIEIDSIEPITLQHINHQLAVESGFLGVIDLLKVAKHGKGDNVYLVRFHYIPRTGKSRFRLLRLRHNGQHGPLSQLCMDDTSVLDYDAGLCHR